MPKTKLVTQVWTDAKANIAVILPQAVYIEYTAKSYAGLERQYQKAVEEAFAQMLGSKEAAVFWLSSGKPFSKAEQATIDSAITDFSEA